MLSYWNSYIFVVFMKLQSISYFIMKDNILFSSPPPSLNPELTDIYNSLDNVNRQLFIKVYRFLWGVVNDRRSGVAFSFWAVDLLRLRCGLTSSELTVLTYLYYVSGKGRRYIHSDLIYQGLILEDLVYSSKPALLNDIKHKGFISRSTRDPGQPYSQRAQHNKHPVFIRLTPAGVKLIEGMEKDLYKLLLHSSIDEITGAKKKPG